MPEKKQGSTVSHPTFVKCCRAGEVDLPLLDPLPDALHALYDGQDRQGKEFHKHICLYNSALALTSTSSPQHLLGSSHDSCGPPHYKIHGKIYHPLGPVRPVNSTVPVFSQLYIYDHNDALGFRTGLNLQRNAHTMETLQSILKRCHPHVDVYLQAYRLMQETELTQYQLQLNFHKCKGVHSLMPNLGCFGW